MGRIYFFGGSRTTREVLAEIVKLLNQATRNLKAASSPPYCSMDQKDFMREAIKLSIESVESGSGGPFGAVIVRDSKIIAHGANLVTSSNDPTAHAEVVAIRAACAQLGGFQLTDCEIYCSCEPCPMCLGAIYWARLKAVYFGNSKADAADIQFDDQFIYDEIDKPISKRQLPTKQLLQDEALVAFQKWAGSEAKVEY